MWTCDVSVLELHIEFFSVKVGCISCLFLKKKKKEDFFSTGEVASWSTFALISYKPAHQWPSWNLHLYFDKCCSESNSLGDLETTKGQIESVSQTFVSSIINAPLLFSLSLSLSSFQSIFYQSHFFLSANITQVYSCFSVPFFISFSLWCIYQTCWFFRSHMWSLSLSFSISFRIPFLWSYVNILPSHALRISLHPFLSAPLSGLVFPQVQQLINK